MLDIQRRKAMQKLALLGGGMALFSTLDVQAKMLEKDVPKWDEEYDAIVVGSGYAGTAAMLSMMDKGLKNVLMIDKMQYMGGNSSISGGSYAMSRTSIQKENGVVDDPEMHIKDTLKSGHNLNNPEMVRIMAYEGLDAFNWLVDNGVKWKLFSRSGGHSAPRNHSVGVGSYITMPLQEQIIKRGGQQRTRIIMDELVYNDKGIVIGMKVREKYEFKFDRAFDENDNKTGKVKYYRANAGVVLATGGWAADPKVRQIFDPSLTPNMPTTNHYGATGYTIQKLIKDDVDLIDMQYIQIMHVTSADEDSFGFAFRTITSGYSFGMMINPKTGRRFVNEIADRKISSDAIFAMNEGGKNHPILFMDVNGAKTVEIDELQRGIEAGAVYQFETLDEMIAKFNINKEPFLEELKKYNAYVKAGKDPDFNRTFSKYKGATITIEQPPFFAARPGPKIHHCMGGVHTTVNCEVFNKSGKLIEGLFACGEVTGGRHGYNRLGSNSVVDCIVFGRRAGFAIAERYQTMVRS